MGDVRHNLIFNLDSSVIQTSLIGDTSPTTAFDLPGLGIGAIRNLVDGVRFELQIQGDDRGD